MKGGYAIVSGLQFYNNEMPIAGKWTGKTDFNDGSAVDTLISKQFFVFFLMSVSPSTVSVNEFSSNQYINAYPNPTYDRVNIKANNRINSIIAYDQLGRTIKIDINTFVDFDSQTTGLIILLIKTTTGTAVKKVFVQ
jgi:hypothetical protein